jgi:gamma-glutamyltranspeptidase/glutathione hydrolase
MPGAKTVHAPTGMVASIDHLASAAGVAALRAGGTAADAVVATGAVLAVTQQGACGLGGDLFALVHRPGDPVSVLCAAGRAGSGADAAGARADGLARLPLQGDIRAVTVPGCVDGLVELHARHGRLPLARVLEPAIGYAAAGFPATLLTAMGAPTVLDLDGADDYREAARAAGGRLTAGALIRRPGVAAALAAVATEGRAGFYEGPFGAGLVALGAGLFTPADLARSQASWVAPLAVRVWGYDVFVPPPPSQGYLVLLGAAVAEGLDLPADPGDAAWAHLLAETSRATGLDRDAVLYDGADGAALLAPGRVAALRAAVDPARRGALAPPAAAGGTTVCCAVDGERAGVTLILSNASGFGAHIVEPATRVFLHDRGVGFSLEPGHPAELAPGRRPPHTLAPGLVCRPDGSLRAVVGTMGGDNQPQVMLQLLTRLLVHGQSPGRTVCGPRFVLGAGSFDLWHGDGPGEVLVEADAPAAWDEGLRARGHTVRRAPEGIAGAFGHAQVVEVTGDGVLAGVADPRAIDGAAAGY